MWQCSECSYNNQNNTAKCTNCEAPRPAHSYIGERISEWVIKKKLGEGGMAMVFLAHHTMLGNPVAIKLLRPEVTHKRDVVERFRTEALAASHLRHENVIQVIHFGKQEGIGTYMVLEFLEGMDLETKLLEAPLDTTYILGIAEQLCAGLEAAHAAGIIHRDLKPSNIFLVPRAHSSIPQVKILDFGIAKIQESHLLEGQQNLTRTGTVLGTPYYLSPEQLRRRKSEELGASVDIYAFGVILYQMFTGKLPLEEATLAEQMAAILTHQPPLAGTIVKELSGSALELYLHRLLSKSPQDRPPTINAAWEELTKAAGVLGRQEQDSALRSKWESTYQPQFTGEVDVKTDWKTWLWRLAFVLALLIGGSWFGYSFIQKPPSPAPSPTPPRLPPLPQWQIEGTQAFNAKDYKKAIERWNKVIRSRKFTRGSRHYNPKIYRSMSEAWRRLKHRYASLQSLKKYRDEVGEQNLTPAEKRQLQRLEQEMQNKQKFLVQSRKAFQTFLEGKNFRDAFDVYSNLKKIRDPSQPAYIKTSLRIARQLTDRFPQYALAMYNDLEKFKYAIGNRTLQERITTQREHLLQKLQSQRQANLDTLRQHMTQQPIRRRQGPWKKQLIQILLKLLRHADDIQAHQQLLLLSEEYLQRFPKRVRTLLDQYQKLLSRYKRRKDWESWLQPMLNQARITPTRVKGMLQHLQGIEQAHQLTRTLQKHLRQARFQQAKSLIPRLLERWQATCKTTSGLQQYCQQQRKQAQEQANQLTELLPQWKQIKRLALVTNQFKEAKKRFLAFNQQLSKFNWMPPDHRMVRIFSTWERRHRAGQKVLRTARSYERKEDWLHCWSHYKKYLDMYPKAHNARYVRFKQCQCDCKQVVPFDNCERPCVRPKKKR